MKNCWLFLLINLLLVSCSNLYPQEGVNSTPTSIQPEGSGCISPNYPFAFPVNTDLKGTFNTPIPSRWKLQANLPALPEGTKSYDQILLAWTKATGAEIWIRRNIYYADEQSGNKSFSQIWIYQESENKWVEYPVRSADNQIFIGNLYLGRNNTLLASNSGASVGIPGIVIYDQRNREFTSLKGSENLPAGKTVFDPQGILWIVKSREAIYSYDLREQVLKRRIDIPEISISTDSLVDSAVLSPSGELILLNDKGRGFSTTDNEEIVIYNPVTNQLKSTPILFPPWPPVVGLFMDREGRLWFHDLGWMDAKGAWYQMIRSPIFITNLGSSRGSIINGYDLPRIMVESSDGKLWYRSSNGLASLDPITGNWCWFSTMQNADIAEDQNSTLWLVADNYLYSYKLP